MLTKHFLECIFINFDIIFSGPGGSYPPPYPPQTGPGPLQNQTSTGSNSSTITQGNIKFKLSVKCMYSLCSWKPKMVKNRAEKTSVDFHTYLVSSKPQCEDKKN